MAITLKIYGGDGKEFTAGEVHVIQSHGQQAFGTPTTWRPGQPGLTIHPGAEELSIIAFSKDHKRVGLTLTPRQFQDKDGGEAHLMLIHKNKAVNLKPEAAGQLAAWQNSKLFTGDFEGFFGDARRESCCLLNILCAVQQQDPALFQQLANIKIEKSPKNQLQGLEEDRIFATVTAEFSGLLQNAPWITTTLVERHKRGTHHASFACKEKRTMGGALNFNVYTDASAPTVEIDIDYYTDYYSHGVLEAFWNWISHDHTDPTWAYVLRWMDERNFAGGTFNPLFTVDSAPRKLNFPRL